jgi:hypothetical protein
MLLKLSKLTFMRKKVVRNVARRLNYKFIVNEIFIISLMGIFFRPFKRGSLNYIHAHAFSQKTKLLKLKFIFSMN